MSNENGWIGVDLDATLAYYDGWKGPQHIGEPIWPMVQRIKAWMAAGKTVKIFTARASVPEQVTFVEMWCEKNLGVKLEVTNVKDFGMIELWDDRAVGVIPNIGQPKGYGGL